MSDDAAAVLETLQAALAGEHAAIWAYGVVGAQVSTDRRPEAFTALQGHRSARDVLESLIRTSQGAPVAAEASYALPFAITSPADAARLAAMVEDRLAALYADVVTHAAPFRRFGITAMRDVAVKAAQWRGASVAFPGLPERA